jgi:lipoyl(octanoyl) transferase
MPVPDSTSPGRVVRTKVGAEGAAGRVPRVIHLGGMGYAQAYRRQVEHVEAVLAARDAGAPDLGRILLVEHDPVITIGRRPGAARHLVASPELLARQGVEVVETDRGGDITYHGRGQLVCYPILDLNTLKMGLHAYMRMLEEAVIGVCGHFGIPAGRDAGATGVWVPTGDGRVAGPAKICAMGVRVRKWVTMHGLALNISTNLEHFKLIVPCGLAGRPVTSMEQQLAARGERCPDPREVATVLVQRLTDLIDAHGRGSGTTV